MSGPSSGIGLLTTDATFAIQSWNSWLETVSGLSEAEVRGRSLLDLVPERSRQSLRDLVDEVLQTGATRVLASALHQYLIRAAPPVPSRFFADMQQYVTIAPLRDEHVIVGLMITIEDVTERRDRERELAEQIASNPTSVSPAALVEAVGAANWRVRAEAARALREATEGGAVTELVRSLERHHLDLNVLSGSLQVLIAAKRDVVVPLAPLLTDGNPNLRMHAAQALGLIDDRRAISPLVGALADADPNVRFHALEALGRLRAPEAVEALVQVAQSEDFFLAFPAVDALARIDDPSVAPELAALLDRPVLRPAVVDALAAIGDEECVAPLMRGLDDATLEPGAVAAALSAIHDRYEAEGAGLQIRDTVAAAATRTAIAGLIAALESRRQPLAPLVRVLGWIGADALAPLVGLIGESAVRTDVHEAIEGLGTAAVDPVAARLHDGTREVRLAAAELLGRLADRRATPALIEAMRHGDAELTVIAANAVATLGDPRALEPLFELFSDVQAPVRRAAVAAVNSLGAQDTATHVRKGLTHPNAHVRESAVRVAGYFGFDWSTEAITRALDDADESVRRAAIEQLPFGGDSRNVARLLEALQHETPSNRAAAAHALKSTEASDVARALVAALEDPDAWVRYFAADALGIHGQDLAAAALATRAAEDAVTHVRIAAIRSLGMLDASASAPLASQLTESGDDDLARAALEALTTSTNAETEERLRQIVRGARPVLRLAAVEVLGARATEASVAMLVEAARLPVEPSLGPAAIAALARVARTGTDSSGRRALEGVLDLGSDAGYHDLVVDAVATLPVDALAWLEPHLVSPRAATRRLVVECAARLRHPAASGLLVQALGDTDPSVRSSAVNAVGRLGPLAAAGATAALASSDPDPAVRRRAAAACRRHGWSVDRERGA